MTEPLASQEPSSSGDQPGGHEAPKPDMQKSADAPMVNPPAYSAPPAYSGPPGMAAGPGPFSPLVGRQLTSDETTWSMLSHLGGIVLGFLVPLVVMLTKGNESPYTKYHSVEALNFQITILIGYVVASVLTLAVIGLILFPVLIIVNIVFCVMAGMAANKGETYKYPFTLRLVK
jgi:uncharacterized protein